MTDQENLQLIIETALKHGWTMFGFAGRCASWNINPGDENYQTWLWIRMDERMNWQGRFTLNDLLYGDNLSLLKAACLPGYFCKTCKENIGDTNVGVRQGKCGDCWDFSPQLHYHYVAQQSVLLPDSERLAFIVEHLRHD